MFWLNLIFYVGDMFEDLVEWCELVELMWYLIVVSIGVGCVYVFGCVSVYCNVIF